MSRLINGLFSIAFFTVFVSSAAFARTPVKAQEKIELPTWHPDRLPPRPDYYSPVAEEATLDFDGYFQDQIYEASRAAEGQQDLNRLMYYAAGPMATAKIKLGNKYDNIPTMTAVRQDGLPPQLFNLYYHYQVTVAIDKKQNGSVDVVLPKMNKDHFSNPVLWFELAQNPKGLTAIDKNPCMDSKGYFLTSDYFWYFWNPYMEKCKLVQGVDYDVFHATVTPHPRVTQAKYPDYPRLVRNNEIHINIIFGADTDANGERPPDKNNTDFNVGGFIAVTERLHDLGFTSHRWTSAELHAYCPIATSSPQVIEEFTRMDGARKVTIKMLWGVTHSDVAHQPVNQPFACLLNEGLDSGSMFVYNAHSGMGQAAFLQDLRKDTGLPLIVNKELYQIYAFNACSTYSYYNLDFFKDKATRLDPYGSRNLQVISNALPGNFYKFAQATLAEIEPVLNWSRTGRWDSYQSMLDRVESGSFSGVNGLADAPNAPY